MTNPKFWCSCPQWHQYINTHIYFGHAVPDEVWVRIGEMLVCPYCAKGLMKGAGV